MKKISFKIPENTPRKQLFIFGLLLIILISFLVWVKLPKSDSMTDEYQYDIGTKRIEISKIANGQNSFDQFMSMAEREKKKLNESIKAQEKANVLLEEKFDKLQKKVDENTTQSSSADIDILAAEVAKLREENEGIKEQIDARNSNNEFDVSGNAKSRIQNIEFSSSADTNGVKTFEVENYIPAGSYVTASVISGVDASVGVNSQSEPKPALFRVKGKAISAIYKGKPQEIDVDGCMITGAASGELSSEKVFVRLLKMSCSREEGKVFETSVKGYVAGIGKTGIRGDVVSREGDFVFKSFLAGISTGVGNGLAQKFANPIALPSGTATQKASTRDILGSGVGKGIENSSQNLSDYLIKRAEQYQPVISIPSGIDVEIVFNEGVHLDSLGGENE